MRYFFSCFFIALLTLGLVVNEASAARFGKGRSFGVQRSQSSFSKPYSPPKNTSSQPARKNTGLFASALGGMLLGGLLASLFMGNGLGSGILSWIILGLVVYFIIKLFRRRQQPAFQMPHSSPSQRDQFSNVNYPSSASPTSSYLDNFNADDFLRTAKVTFTRLQAAYDQKDLQDISEFTSPEIFAEVKMQLDERGDAENKTVVLDLEAELLDVTRQVNDVLASVRFTGFVKENNETMMPLNEIWHFRQLNNTGKWQVVGIQQEI